MVKEEKILPENLKARVSAFSGEAGNEYIPPAMQESSQEQTIESIEPRKQDLPAGTEGIQLQAEISIRKSQNKKSKTWKYIIIRM